MTKTYDLPEFPMPGQTFDDAIVVASGWCSDSNIGVLLIHPDRVGEFYSLGEYRQAGTEWEQMWSECAQNIVPAAQRFDDHFGFWGGN